MKKGEQMTTEEIKHMLKTNPEYSFLKTNEHLNQNVILLGLGGSYAYGLNKETSDIDIRGAALNSKREILLREDFEQVTDDNTDTVIYSFNKILSLLSDCNPNTIEILGLNPEHYLYVSPIGQELINNRKWFLSKKAIFSFGGYAIAQLRRLENYTMKNNDQSHEEEHILKTIKHAQLDFKNRYTSIPDDAIRLYIDKAVQKGFDTEIFMDLHLTHYPLRDYKCMWSEMHSIVKSYAKVGKRNGNAIEHNKLGKHMCHLFRLYMMCLDILEKEEIITYRASDHNLLMDIKNGKYLDDNNIPLPEFYEMLDEYEKKMDYAKENTNLPDNPDCEKINEFRMAVNEQIVKGDF